MERKEENMFKSHSNMYELIKSNLDIMGKIMDNIIRDFTHDIEITKYILETEEQVGIKFDFYTNLSFFGYAKDGNTKIYDEADPIRIYTSVMFSGSTVWVSNKLNFHDENNWIMTGSHSSCYFDGWDNPVFEEILRAYDSLIPEGYWDNPEHSNRPISVFMTPDGFDGFGKKVAIQTEHHNNLKDPFKSFDEIKSLRDYNLAIAEANEMQSHSSFKM
jgi:hypothetical protein